MIVAETNKGTPSSSVTALAAAGPADGSDRGAVLMGIVFLVSVWIFSIPPEFRRAHICTSDLCVGKNAIPQKVLVPRQIKKARRDTIS